MMDFHVSQFFPDPDIKNVKTSKQMLWYFKTNASKAAHLNMHGHFLQAFLVAEQTLKDYKIYKKKKNVSTSLQTDNLDSFNTCFQLLIIQLKISPTPKDKTLIENINIKLVKDMIVKSYHCKECIVLLASIINRFQSSFVNAKYMEIGKKFLVIFKNCNEELYKQIQCKDDDDKEMKDVTDTCSELCFMESVLSQSLLIIMKDSIWTEKREAYERQFDDLLDLLGLEDCYPTISFIIQTYKQVEKFTDLMLKKIDEYEKLRPLNIFVSFWRGQAYFSLAAFQKETSLKIEPTTNSLKHWNHFLAEYCSEQQLSNCVKDIVNDYYDYNLRLYVVVVNSNLINYQTIINSKVHSIMHLEPSDPNVKPVIRELNILRRDHILQLELALKFSDVLENLPWGSLNLEEIYKSLCRNYRSIVLDNKKNQKRNLDNSLQYLHKSFRLAMSKDPTYQEDASLEKFSVGSLIQILDEAPFVKKFRKD